MPGPDRRTATALLVAGTFFMEYFNATVIAPALPKMAVSFASQPVDLSTGISAYMLTLGIFIPVSGWIADRFGARKVFATAIAIFTIASVLSGMARSLPEFVVMRVLQGIGGAMMVPVGRLVVLRGTPKDQLIRAIATLTWPAMVAPVVAPLLGGLITDYANWRWIFYLNLPLGILAFAGALLLVPDMKGQGDRRFDWTGFGLVGSAVFCLLYVVELVDRPAIATAETAAFAVIGIVLTVFGLRHLRRCPHPMIDLSCLEVQTFAVSIYGASLFRMVAGAVPFLVPLMFQIGFGYSATAAGGMLMAMFAGALLMKPLTTPALRRFGFRPVLVVNGLLNVAGVAIIAGLTDGMPLALICLILFLGGMTRSMQFTAFNTLAFADMPQKSMSVANTLFSAAFQLAFGLGVALGAITLRIGDFTAPMGAAPVMPFRIAFILVALVALVSIWDSLALSRTAGEHVSKRQPAKS